MPTGKSLPGPLSQAVATILSQALPAGNQASVAKDAGMSASQLSRVLSGEKVFKLDELDGVCRALRLDIVKVISEADSASREERNKTAQVVDLTTVKLESHRIAASTKQTPIDPSRGEA